MFDFIKEKDLDIYLQYFGKSRKKFMQFRYLYGFLFFLIGAMVALLFNHYLTYILLPIIAFVGYKVPYVQLILNKRKQDLINSYLFPQFLQSFLALLTSSGNVYQTLVASIDYTSEPLKTELKKLVARIEQSNNRDDYLAFADYVGTSEAFMIMDMIYQFSEFGVRKDSLEELERYIYDLQENKIDELIQRKMLEMDKLGFIPIFISLFLVGGFAVILFMHYMNDVMSAVNFL